MNRRSPRFERGCAAAGAIDPGIRATKKRVEPSAATKLNSRSSPGAAPSGTVSSLETPSTSQVNVLDAGAMPPCSSSTAGAASSASAEAGSFFKSVFVLSRSSVASVPSRAVVSLSCCLKGRS